MVNHDQDQNKITFQFISEPTDVNFGGKVHGGVVMKWIDQTAYACAIKWAESYCVTVYVGGIRFLRPINIGEIIRIKAKVIYTGRSSIHIAVDVYSRGMEKSEFLKTTHCVIVFVNVDDQGKPIPVKKFVPDTTQEVEMEKYAKKLMELRKDIQDEMTEFFD